VKFRIFPSTVEGDEKVLKKAGVVVAAAVGLSMLAPAMASASPTDVCDVSCVPYGSPAVVNITGILALGGALGATAISDGSAAIGNGAAVLAVGANLGIVLAGSLIDAPFCGC
jgi:hypothetical protein